MPASVLLNCFGVPAPRAQHANITSTQPASTKGPGTLTQRVSSLFQQAARSIDTFLLKINCTASGMRAQSMATPLSRAERKLDDDYIKQLKTNINARLSEMRTTNGESKAALMKQLANMVWRLETLIAENQKDIGSWRRFSQKHPQFSDTINNKIKFIQQCNADILEIKQGLAASLAKEVDKLPLQMMVHVFCADN